jgi:hypothetical protein
MKAFRFLPIHICILLLSMSVSLDASLIDDEIVCCEINMDQNGKTIFGTGHWFRTPVPAEEAMANFKQHQV